jgi:hypothetical protein
MEISTDRDRIDREMVHRFLSEQSFWARSRTRAQGDRVIDAWLCFGAYEAGGRQVEHARVLTDSACTPSSVSSSSTTRTCGCSLEHPLIFFAGAFRALQ